MSCLNFFAVGHRLHILLIWLLGVYIFKALHMLHGPIRSGHSTAKVQGGLLPALLRLLRPS